MSLGSLLTLSQYSEDDNGGGKAGLEQRNMLDECEDDNGAGMAGPEQHDVHDVCDVYKPFEREVSIIPVGRGSPLTKNEGAYQNTVLRTAVDLLEEADYFPRGKILRQTIFGYNTSGYAPMTSLFYRDLLRQVYEHADSNKDKKDDDKLDLLIRRRVVTLPQNRLLLNLRTTKR